MTSNGNALLNLINDILDLAKIESGRLRLEADRRSTSKSWSSTGRDPGRARARERAGTGGADHARRAAAGLIGDPLRLRQVLINLVGNAIKFTEQGEVVLTVENDPEADQPGALRFIVRDTGIGIAAEKLETIFESFTQADSSTTRKYGGSGLGLAIVRRLVELMGGRIWATSQPGIGQQHSSSPRDSGLAARRGARPAEAVAAEGTSGAGRG